MKNKSSDYFEGWYLKHTIREEVFAFIISIHRVRHQKSYVYVQFIDSQNSYSRKVPIKQCSFSRDSFYIDIDGSVFSDKGIQVDMSFGDLRIRCNINYGELTVLDNPIMGPFRHLPRMQCSHDVISLSHELSGFIDMNGKYVPLDNGVGYIEKDQGWSFPSSYLWTQTNFHHLTPGNIMLAVAKIPYGLINFTGVICSILYRGTEYRIGTYNGGRVLFQSKEMVIVSNNKMCLIVNVVSQNPLKLAAPVHGDMTALIHESAKSKIRYRFYIRSKKIFDFISETAGYEYVESLN